MNSFNNLVGFQLGKYKLTQMLGRGGMAEVYEAYQPGLDRQVAIKVLRGYWDASPDWIDRFKREARSIAQLRHPNIIQVFDFDVQNDLYYMVMEYVRGGSLGDWIRKNGALPLDKAVRVAMQLADALDYAHRSGLIHRDIKPVNVLFSTGSLDHPVLTDFGIAYIVGESMLTATGGIIGTPAYLSPEVGRGEKADERSDIYSLGIMLYEMLTGRVPFKADTSYGLIMQHINEPPPPPRQINPNIPEGLQGVVYRTLAKPRSARYQTAGDLRRALADVETSMSAGVASAGATGSYYFPASPAETRLLPPLDDDDDFRPHPAASNGVAVTNRTHTVSLLEAFIHDAAAPGAGNGRPETIRLEEAALAPRNTRKTIDLPVIEVKQEARPRRRSAILLIALLGLGGVLCAGAVALSGLIGQGMATPTATEPGALSSPTLMPGSLIDASATPSPTLTLTLSATATATTTLPVDGTKEANSTATPSPTRRAVHEAEPTRLTPTASPTGRPASSTPRPTSTRPGATSTPRPNPTSPPPTDPPPPPPTSPPPEPTTPLDPITDPIETILPPLPTLDLLPGIPGL